LGVEENKERKAITEQEYYKNQDIKRKEEVVP